MIDGSKFDYEAIRPSTLESKRIRSLSIQRLKDGRLTKDPKGEKHWVGAFLMRKLSTALLKDGLGNGTLNWDITISRVLSIVLIAIMSTWGILQNIR